MARSAPTLLAGDAPRSEHDPDLEAAATATTSIAMHPVTGAFADPTHELAFAAQFFRLAFPCHVLLLALPIATATLIARVVPPDMWAWTSLSALFGTLGLIGRVLVHRIEDTVSGQRMGSWAWTAVMVVSVLTDMIGYAVGPSSACQAMATYYSSVYPIFAFVFALVNGSHGMGFAHKAGLIGGGVLFDLNWVPIMACGTSLIPWASFTLAVAFVGFAVAHLAEMHLRRSYADKQRLSGEKRRLEAKVDDEKRQLEERLEQLRAEKERLLYEVQHRGRPLDDDDDRSAIRRGLQAGPSQPYHRADSSTDSGKRGAPAPSDSPPASLPPGPPSSPPSSPPSISDHKSSKSDESGKETGNSSRAVHDKSKAPPTKWAELDAQFYAERAAESAAKQGLAPGAPSSTAGATSSTAGLTTAPPPSWAELAYRRFYAERAARSTTAEQGVPPPMDQPPSWADLDTQHYAAEQGVELGSSEQGVELAEEELAPPAAPPPARTRSEEELAAARALTGISQRPPSR